MNAPLTVLDLFSGIGGFSLGLERCGGFKTVAFCEIDPFCRAVLRKHWPAVPIYEDVQSMSVSRGFADVLCGGFPCQDISLAGRGAGLAGERSGLWAEYARLIEEVHPRYAIIENVSALRARGLDEVLRSLAAVRYDAEWHCIPACSIGAPHRRDRIWIVAYPHDAEWRTRDTKIGCAEVAHTHVPRLERWLREELRECARQLAARPRGALANPDGDSRNARGPSDAAEGEERRDADRSGVTRSIAEAWRTEPDVGRVAHGVPARVDRLRALGNAVVPQIPQIIGQAILNYEANKV